jgi:hypothetical protein
MKSRPLGIQPILATDHNTRRDDARGGSFLLAHQQLGALALPTNPTNGQTLTVTVNGTGIVITYVTSIGSTPNNILIQGSAAVTVAATVNFLRRPDIANANQVAATLADQQLLQYVGWALPSGGTTLTPFSLDKEIEDASKNLTSFTASTTVTSASWTAQTMQLYVEDGTYYTNGTRYLFVGASTPTVTAPSSHPRIDVLTIDTTGTLAWTAGTENASPVAPAYPANKLAICELYNVVGETALYDNENQQSGQGYISNDVRPTVSYGPVFGAIPEDLIPDSADTRSLGSGGSEWLDVYAKNIYATSVMQLNGANVEFSKFGGTGADGALSITSGTTTINASNAAVVVKNYTAISITGTASLTISNPNANGTILILKSQGAVTITSSASAAINMANMGASAGNSGYGLLSSTGPYRNLNYFTTGYGWYTVSTAGGQPGTGAFLFNGKALNIFAGGGGAAGTGGGTNGAGGIGGGGLYIECGGALNVTGTLTAPGANGTNGSGGSGTTGGWAGGGGGGGASPGADTSVSYSNSSLNGGGGGGGGGSIVIIYNTLTTNIGTYTVTGGSGGSSSAGIAGGAGGAGISYVGPNTEFA